MSKGISSLLGVVALLVLPYGSVTSATNPPVTIARVTPARATVTAAAQPTAWPATVPAISRLAGNPPDSSPIQHVVIIDEENHSFDNVFGRYCRQVANGLIARDACDGH